jgi:hypothetical protein
MYNLTKDWTPEQKAVNWFIQRFIHKKEPKIFAMRTHGLLEMNTQQAYLIRKTHHLLKHAQYNFGIEPAGTVYPNYWRIVPNSPAATWCAGHISIDHGEYTFHSMARASLFQELDKAE